MPQLAPALTVSAVIVSLAAFPGHRQLRSTGSESAHLRHEVARLRAHFDSVEGELRQRDVLRLTSAQRTARVTLIGWLREYRNAGRFPVNDRFALALPFFRDSRGTLCAMAYLIQRSGNRDLVDRIAGTRNNAFIPDLADDPVLRGWLDSVGLSLSEAARIQPTYEPPPPEVPSDKAVTASYALTSILVSGASLTTLGLNLISPDRSTAWAGVVAGSVAFIAGAVNLDGPGDSDKVAAANMIAGTGALVGGLYRLLSTQPTRAQRRSWQVIPTSGGSRVGLAVHTSF